MFVYNAARIISERLREEIISRAENWADDYEKALDGCTYNLPIGEHLMDVHVTEDDRLVFSFGINFRLDVFLKDIDDEEKKKT